MSLLHSFYCWGCTGVVLISTIFFTLFGISHWKILTLLWTILPIANMLLFTKVPIYSLQEEGEKGMNLGELFREKMFWILMLMMVCSGAAEQSVSQWASTFAEKGLGITKSVGDLVGFVSGGLGDNLRLGIFAGIIFPVLLLGSLMLGGRRKNNSKLDLK